jgi:hypothetical protein
MSDLPFGCNCDPYDCGPASHSEDCPALPIERDWISVNRAKLGLVDELLREMERQDRNYGCFSGDVPGVRLAVAALEDEIAEVRAAWRRERKVPEWDDTITEALQLAAVALRLVRDARIGPLP